MIAKIQTLYYKVVDSKTVSRATFLQELASELSAYFSLRDFTLSHAILPRLKMIEKQGFKMNEEQAIEILNTAKKIAKTKLEEKKRAAFST